LFNALFCRNRQEAQTERIEEMNDETRKQIALTRFKLISPVLAEPRRAQNAYFREQAKEEHHFPHYGPRIIKLSTFKSWLRGYRKEGFDALMPKPRNDSGRPRRLSDLEMGAIRGKCKAYPHLTVQKLYENLLQDNQLGRPPICYNTLLRIVHRENLLPEVGRTDVRKRYETPSFGELWVCDFMHGPKVEVGTHLAKSILCAVIDDHTRMIVGHAFAAEETVSALITVLKEAFLTYGLPKRLYVDNGPAFSSELLLSACAQSRIALVHSKPYDSPSRGKIERFFRTVRDRFLSGLSKEVTLDEINEAFSLWLKEDYHHKVHGGIDEKPIDRYHRSLKDVEMKRLTSAELDEVFLMRHERVVGNDATISFKGKIYEVPAAYIRQRIEIRHPVDDREALFLFENGARIAKLKPVDLHENARTFRPDAARSEVRFARPEMPQ
jgi:transposase InsO family protein